MTKAKQIASQYDNDGQCFEDYDGMHITHPCGGLALFEDTRGDSTRYEFRDGSAIVITGGGWDVGHPAPAACHCWPDANHGGHQEDCEEGLTGGGDATD